MARIECNHIRHAYGPHPKTDKDYALNEVHHTFEDGGAYALLGPSGCGKTTLLNLISGLLTPTEGRIVFDGRDVTNASPEERNIAQVFQFPVIYDTMTVYDNLAFPLRNRRVGEREVDERVREVAAMLELDTMLNQHASGLTADGKQKISLGRGLVRSDVNVIMFDEPLTVIDPHLKWVLRVKVEGAAATYPPYDDLCHSRSDRSAHLRRSGCCHEGWRDRADRHAGRAFRAAEPYLRRPLHRLAGHEPAALRGKGRPGFCRRDDRDGQWRELSRGRGLELGVRPELVSFAPEGIPVDVVKVLDAGSYRIVETRQAGHTIKMLVSEDDRISAGPAHVRFAPDRTRVYENGGG